MIPDAIRDNSKMHRCHDNDESNYVDEFILMLFWIDDDDEDDDDDDDSRMESPLSMHCDQYKLGQ